MPVPRMSELRPGVAVNIVLKADQATGRITTGYIADILTRGDHPRGIKVRLTTGQVGRVQSMSSRESTAGASSTAQPSSPQLRNAVDGNMQAPYKNRRNQNPRNMTRDVRQDYFPEEPGNEALSLFDYVQTPRRPTPGSASAVSNVESQGITVQEQLETEFSNLDSALIAAILADYPDQSEARTVLSSLS